MTISVKGLAGLKDQLEALGDELTQAKKLRTAGRRAFKPVQEAAQARAPVDTGVLRDSIVIATALPKEGGPVVAVGLTIKGKAESLREHSAPVAVRWRYAEQGTRFQPARPFLRPALDENSSAVVEGLASELRKSIDRVVKKGKK